MEEIVLEGGPYQGGVVSASVVVPPNVSTLYANAYISEADRGTDKNFKMYAEKSTDGGENWTSLNVSGDCGPGPWEDEPYVGGIGFGVSGLAGKRVRIRLDIPESISFDQVKIESGS